MGTRDNEYEWLRLKLPRGTGAALRRVCELLNADETRPPHNKHTLASALINHGIESLFEEHEADASPEEGK